MGTTDRLQRTKVVVPSITDITVYLFTVFGRELYKLSGPNNSIDISAKHYLFVFLVLMYFVIITVSNKS